MATRFDDRVGRSPQARRTWFAVAALAMLAIASACCSVRPHEAPGSDAIPAVSEAIAARAASLRALRQFEATGVCRVQVPREDGGFDEEQLDVLLVLERPLRTALRLKISVSDTLAWIGSDGTRWWLFLPEESPPVAYRGAIEPSWTGSAAEVSEAPVPRGLRHPRLFWLLAGLEPPREGVPAPSWDPAVGAWRLDELLEHREQGDEGPASSSAATVRRWFDAAGNPIRVEVSDAAGAIVAASRLSAFVSIEMEGMAMGAWPRVASRIALEGESGGIGGVLVLERPSGKGSRAKPALFDWDRLAASMRPERVIEVEP